MVCTLRVGEFGLSTKIKNVLSIHGNDWFFSPRKKLKTSQIIIRVDVVMSLILNMDFKIQIMVIVPSLPITSPQMNFLFHLIQTTGPHKEVIILQLKMVAAPLLPPQTTTTTPQMAPQYLPKLNAIRSPVKVLEKQAVHRPQVE